MAEKTDKSLTNEEILKEAQALFADSQDGTDFIREQYEKDVKFARLGNQWPQEVLNQRELESRPALTVNKLPSFIRQVVNDAKQNKPGIQVTPVDGGSDEETADVIEGLIRNIERNSNATQAYGTALDHSVSGGFGFFHIGIDFAHPMSFEMEARIHRIANPLMVHWDSNSLSFDASDWDYGFISEFVDKDTFEERFPKATPVEFQGDEGDRLNYWMMQDQIRLVRFWHRVRKERKIFQLSNGQVVKESTWDEPIEGIGLEAIMGDDLPTFGEVMRAQGIVPTKERMAPYHEVTRTLLSGVEVLEEPEDWPGSTIPICPVWGEEVISDGRRYVRSMHRDSKDSQVMFNYWRSASTELVALAPKAPFIGPKGFVPPEDKQKWQSANVRSHAYLEYDPAAGGVPQRQAFAGVPAGVIQEALNASDDIKATTGIYDAGLGARGNETSGRAILARQRESDVSNFHFIDNLRHAIEYAGKVLVEIIPHVYSDREAIRILGEDMKESVAKIGRDVEGQDKLYDLTVGKYDVHVRAGPSYATQREETREVLMEIMRAVPGAAQFIGDILMDNLDFRGADKVAQRLRALLPPNIQAAEGIAPTPTTPQGQAPIDQPQVPGPVSLDPSAGPMSGAL